MKFLTKEQKSSYEENGFVLLENVFSQKEVDEIQTEYDKIFKRKEDEQSQMKALWDGSWQKELIPSDKKVHVLSIHNLQNHSAVFTRTLMHPKLLDALEDVVGSPNLILHHTKAHLKPPENGAPFPMHQDYHYFPYKEDSMVAVFIHLDDTTPENGGLAVFPGSHKNGPLEDKGDSMSHYVDQTKFNLNDAVPVVAKKGDVLIFSYLTVHGSYLNTSTRTRKMFLIQIASAEDTPLKDIHISPGHGMLLRGENVKANADLKWRGAFKQLGKEEATYEDQDRK